MKNRNVDQSINTKNNVITRKTGEFTNAKSKVALSQVLSEVLPNGVVIETVLDKTKRDTKLAVRYPDKIAIVRNIKSLDGKALLPFSASNNLIVENLILLPSEPVEFESIDGLVSEVRKFVHRYVDLSNDFELLSTYYVLLSWVYDCFNELPYLRKVGDFGSGKTRFLKVLGSICYKPVFASGGTSTAALFHITDKVRGTLILDEADFSFTDERSDIAKILNNGNSSGFPILRVTPDSNGKYQPISYNVFGPKIIASRNHYTDQALESRFISEKFNPTTSRMDIPTTLPTHFEQEALSLRNKLLSYRFKMRFKIKPVELPKIHRIEGRIDQIFSPLAAVAHNMADRERIIQIACKYSQLLLNRRSEGLEAQVLFTIKQLQSEKRPLTIKEITAEFSFEYSSYYERKVTAKWIGSIVRNNLNISTRKSNGNFILDENGLHNLLSALYSRYSV